MTPGLTNILQPPPHPRGPTRRITVEVPEALWRLLSLYAARTDRSLARTVTTACATFLDLTAGTAPGAHWRSLRHWQCGPPCTLRHSDRCEVCTACGTTQPGRGF